MRQYTLFALALVAGCSKKDDATLAAEIAQGIIAACPAADPSDEKARADCAQKLTDLQVFADAIQEPLMYGGQKPGAGYRLDKSTTKFNGLVWRRMYCSLFMFDGTYSLEQVAGYTVIHLPIHFRNKLDPGSYSYPFWHSKTKWDSWQYAKELLLIMQNGKISGALRSSDFDMTRDYNQREWDGQWHWTEGGAEEPYVSLYTYLFSKDNPHVAQLDQAYRAFEAEARQQQCFVCHAPNNYANVDQLVFFNYPNQALYSRHLIVEQLQQNLMPPDNDAGIPKGIADDGQRQSLLDRARAFAAAGDDALAFEGALKEQAPSPPDMAMGK